MSQASAIESNHRERPAGWGFSLRNTGLAEYAALLGIWIALLALFGGLSEHFLSRQTFGSLANRIPTLAVVAGGTTLVLIVGGIDLSVGSLLGLCGALLGVAMMNWHWPLWAAAIFCVAAGLAVGAVNGAVSVLFGIPSFIVTLGMLEVARGLAYFVTDSQTKYIGSAVEPLSRPFSGTVLSPSFFIAMAMVAGLQAVLSFGTFGRRALAIGSNEQAARFSGVDPRPVKIAVFALLGSLTGLGALFHTSRLGSSDPNAGVGLELSAIAAAVIGGTSLIGGRGSVARTFFGVLIIATLEAGLAQVGASEPSKRIITGGVIIVAVLLDAWRHRWTGGVFGKLKRSLPG